MKFYNRDTELTILNKAEKLKKKHSVMTLIIGRRRIGKTTLALKAIKNPIYFLFLKKKKLFYVKNLQNN